jgi:hypothetical protein
METEKIGGILAKKIVITKKSMKNHVCYHYAHNAFFENNFRKSVSGFQKWTKINVQN